MTAALILMPTFDHQDTLFESIAAVRRQTVDDWNLVVILDGSPPRTKDIVEHFAALDSRISFVQRPKGPRLGEAWRDDVIRSSDAQIVTHATDDDLWSPIHLATLTGLLEDADFAHVALVEGTKSGALIGLPASWASPLTRRATLEFRFNCTGPNQCGYTRAAYLRLERGWETTPPECPWTDAFMWSKFLQLEGLRLKTLMLPTSLKLAAVGREGWSSERRRAELARWAPLVCHERFPCVASGRVDYGAYYRWAASACGVLDQDLRASLHALGVAPIVGASPDTIVARGLDDPAALPLSAEQMQSLELSWRYLRGELRGEELRPWLVREVAINPGAQALMDRLSAITMDELAGTLGARRTALGGTT